MKNSFNTFEKNTLLQMSPNSWADFKCCLDQNTAFLLQNKNHKVRLPFHDFGYM